MGTSRHDDIVIENDAEKDGEIPADLQTDFQVGEELPLLPVRDVVIFPYMVIPLFVGRESSIRAVNDALSKDRIIMLVAQKDASVEDPGPNDIYKIGSAVMIIRMLKLPDGRIKILVQGLVKTKIKDFLINDQFLNVRIERLQEGVPLPKKSLRSEALIRNIRDGLEKVISLGKMITPDILLVVDNLDEPGKLADLVASNLGLKVPDAQQVLEILDSEERLSKISELLNKEIELLSMQQKIQSAAQEEMSKTQREYYLKEQLKAIQKELGEIDERAEEIEEFKEKMKKAKMPKDVEKEGKKQLNRLGKMYPESAEAATIRTYLEWLTELPWKRSTKDNLNIGKASKVLDEDHYGLEKVKERVLEYLGVKKLKKRMKGPILCFAGPPGVGKTSLGKSIARALGRKFVRISLGGVRDEAEIRGHRRTYVGALPGRIIQGINQAESNNPVFMMDEIDKLGADFRGDPAAALLEVLDPEQNSSFADHYLGVPFDLTEVMFITTANIVDTIPSALRDRMEVIHLSGYTEEEKLKIVKQFIVPRQLDEHGIGQKQMTISDPAILKAISEYTREAGLRNIEREIAAICRKVARKIAEGEKKVFHIGAKNLSAYLGIRKYESEEELDDTGIGVATGLAWTQVGGEIMKIEVTTMKGKGGLTLTGQLGDVMKESAQAAMSYTRSQAAQLGLKEDFYSKKDIHIHVPAGAIPKDGPSAGITMAVAIISELTGTPVRKNVAMTGEITLRGVVLPIGGLKEKALAAKRAGICNLIIPQRNEKDIEEIPKDIRKTLHFTFAKTMNDVLKNALGKSVS